MIISRSQTVLACIGVVALLTPACVRFAPAIVERGRPRAEIVVADAPARMTRLAAAELQRVVEKMTGTRLAITNVASAGVPVKLYVGKSKYTEALKISTDGLAHGAFRMASGKDWLALLGPDRDFVPREPWTHNNADRARAAAAWDALFPGEYYGFPYFRFYDFYCPELNVWKFDDAGTMNAVCEFLRALGVRWYFPGELGEIVPKRDEITLPVVNRTVTPDFPMRRFYYWRESPGNWLWNLHLGVNEGPEMMGLQQNCHGSKWTYMRDEIKKAHPEWYAVWDGKRATDHSYSGAPCLSSKELFARHVTFARRMFDLRDEPMLSLDVCDGYGRGMCECPLCKGKGTPERGVSGSMSDYVWDYVNRVALELHKSHPDRKVSGSSYSAYTLPPQKIGTFSPNLAVEVCQNRADFYKPEARSNAMERVQAWLAKLPSKELYVYDYYLQNCPRYSRSDTPVFFMRQIADNLRFLKGLSRGDMIEVYRHSEEDAKKFDWDPMAIMHLNIYVTARLWWDTTQDLDQMLDEYYTLYYGPAAREMKAFVEYSEANWPLMSTQTAPIDKALELLGAARRAAGDSVYGKRVELIAQCCQPLTQRRERLSRGPVPDFRALPRPTAGLTMDGKLDEPFWKVRSGALKDVVTGNYPRQPSEFWVAWGDDEALYVGIRCSERDVTNLAVTATRNGDTNLLSGDFIELVIETPVHSFYTIAVNPAGAITNADRKEGLNTRWQSGATAAVHVGDRYWSLEVRLPVAGEKAQEIDPMNGIAGAKPTPTSPWCINVGRQRVRGGDVERTAWSPTGSSRFDEVRKLGTVWCR